MLLLWMILAVVAPRLDAADEVKTTPLRMGAATSTPLPFADFVIEKGKMQIVQGVYVDIAHELGKQLGVPVEVRTAPRVRIGAELEKGSFDFVCNYRSSWLKGDFLILDDVFNSGDYIVWRQGFKPVKSLSDLEGVRIGTARGYSHPEIEVALGKKFNRVDYEDVDAVIKKMLLKEIDYITLNKINFDFVSNTRIYKGKMTDSPLLVASFRTGCAISQKARIEPMRIRLGLESLLKNGAIKKIMKGYGLENAVP